MNPIQKIKRRILIRRVNKALGIKLYDWQIERIFNDGATPIGGRCVGVTTANVLRLLLNPKFDHANILKYVTLPDGVRRSREYFFECAHAAYLFGNDAVNRERREAFLRILISTRRTLNRAQIKTNSPIIDYFKRH